MSGSEAAPMSDKPTVPIIDVPTELDGFGQPRIPFRGHYEMEKNDLRRKWAEQFAGGKSLEFVSDWWNVEGKEHTVDSQMTLLKGNIENPIGLAKIPLGLVGPVLMHGKHVDGYVLCPFATTEGALVASATRGVTACNRAGGITTHAFSQQMTRGPCFMTASLVEAVKLTDWLVSHLSDLQMQVQNISRHCRLVHVEPFVIGRSVHALFVCESGLAAGQNMVTTATSEACKWMLKEIEKTRKDINILNYWVETNLSSDKKNSYILNSPSSIRGVRGVHAQADVYIPESVLKSVLKRDSEGLLATYHAFHQGNWLIGSPTFTINISNAVAAVFAATGQDIACTVESSSAFFNVERASPSDIQRFSKFGTIDKSEGGLYASMTLPSLHVGTVGGGTGLATQRECLQLMGCDGENGNLRLAEIIAAVCLGLDLSCFAAVASGQFAAAHNRLGKNRPDLGLRADDLNKEFFDSLLNEGEELIRWRSLDVDSQQSILSDLAKVREITKEIGHLGFELEYQPTDYTDTKRKRIIVKTKATDLETCNMLNKIAQGCGGDLAEAYEFFKLQTGFQDTHNRETTVMSMEDSRFVNIAPKVHRVWCDHKKDIFVIAMEKLEDVTHFDTVDDVSQWSIDEIKVALRDIAHFHSIYLDKTDDLVRKYPFFESTTSQERMMKLKPLWTALLKQNVTEFPEMWTPARRHLGLLLIDQIPAIFQRLDSAPRTLVHNDFNLRNVCLRPSAYDDELQADSRRLCAYDWELATVHVPQRDVAEFLSFVLHPEVSHEVRHDLVEYHRQQLESFSGVKLDKNRYHQDHALVCCDLAINRFPLYSMVYTFKDYRFLPRVIACHFNYLQHLADTGKLTFD